MRIRLLCASALALGVLLPAVAVPAGAKDFPPGDLRLCSAARCVPIVDQSLLRALTFFYYSGSAPAETRAPRIGAPYFQLKASNGYLTGIAATAQLDRFRSNGVNMGRFTMEDWYRVPARVALGLRRLAAAMQPLRVTESTIGPTRYG
jgi:hypothetical protein